MFGIDDAIGAAGKVSDLLGKVVDKIWPDPAEAAKAKALIMGAEGQQAVAQLTAELSPILAEAQSPDKWTSRARPSFLYVMYAMILISIPFAMLWAFQPAIADRMSTGLNHWLTAIPDGMWQLFGLGYLGYTGGRTFEKWRGVTK